MCATGCESDGETTIDQVAEVEVALNDVTSFVSVNAAEGYGISDLMDEDPDATTASETEQELNTVTNITSVTVSEYNDGAWSPVDKDHVITFGDNIRTQVDFTTKLSTFKKWKNADLSASIWHGEIKMPWPELWRKTLMIMIRKLILVRLQWMKTAW